jgi:hypothetical protein
MFICLGVILRATPSTQWQAIGFSAPVLAGAARVKEKCIALSFTVHLILPDFAAGSNRQF